MIRVVEFKTQYRIGKDPVDWVLVAPAGAAYTKTQTWHRVSKVRPPEGVDDRTADSDTHKDMVAKWTVIGPAYEAWKTGTELPVDGTPLEAWAGVTPDQAAFLKSLHIRTVEEVRDMGDKDIEAIRWPNARALPKLARDYLEGADSAAKDAELAELRERTAAMEAMLQEMTEAKPKRGRPRKETEAA